MVSTASDGTRFEWRGDDGPAVALIHGLGLNRQMWQWQLPVLAPRYRVLAYDLYGHGDSPRPPSPANLTLFSDQLRRLLDESDVERCAVVGFSLGGMIARRFALDHADRLSALAILNSAHERTAAQRDAILKRVEQAREQGPSSTVEAALERWFSDDFRAGNPDVLDLVRQWVMANDKEVYPDIYRVLADGVDEIVEPIKTIRCPTLVMTGEEDFGNSPEMTRAIAESIAGARAVVLPGLRHMALAEAPEVFNQALVSFLDQVLA